MLNAPNAKLLTFDPAAFLDNQEAVQTADPAFITDKLGLK
jgi:hypothetical protein